MNGAGQGKKQTPNLPVRLAGVVLGVLMQGFGLAFIILADFGTDPLSTVCLALTAYTPLSYGTWQLLCNFTLLLCVLALDRSMIGVGTVVNMLLIGYAADFFGWALRLFFPVLNGPLGMGLRIGLLVPGLAVFVCATAAYVSAGLGTGAYDAPPFILSRRVPRVSLRTARWLWDAAFVILGFVLGGKVGAVTFLSALLLGPVISLLGGWFARHLYRVELR